jgi:hypothetical protein
VAFCKTDMKNEIELRGFDMPKILSAATSN